MEPTYQNVIFVLENFAVHVVYKFTMLLKVVFIILSPHLIQQESISAPLIFLYFSISDSEHRLDSFLWILVVS